jgi:hypothetical protein
MSPLSNWQTCLPVQSAVMPVHSKKGVALHKRLASHHAQTKIPPQMNCAARPQTLARLHYIRHNPAKHGIVDLAENYKWCSASWFARMRHQSL